jgi:predicted nucleic acid-binding protein
VRIYLDVSCLNRPFDDQSQSRIRLEAEAVRLILARCDDGAWEHVSSEMATLEIDAMPDRERRARVRLLLPEANGILKLTRAEWSRGAILEGLGFKPADAVHVAAAEQAKADVLLSCDDRLCKLAKRSNLQIQIRVVNPVDWLKEVGDGQNP